MKAAKLDPYTLRQVAAWHLEQRNGHQAVPSDAPTKHGHDWQAHAHWRSYSSISAKARRLEKGRKR